MENIQIWKGEEEVGSAPPPPVSHSMVLPESPKWPGVGEITCYYFPRVKLSPPVVWKVMAGTALGCFLDHCTLKNVGEPPGFEVSDLRYVHGRAETMRGNPTISTVLLARVQVPDLRNEVWLTYLPAIYSEFLRLYDSSKKDS